MTPDLNQTQTIALSAAIVGATFLCLLTAALVLIYQEQIRGFLHRRGVLIVPPPMPVPPHYVELPRLEPALVRPGMGAEGTITRNRHRRTIYFANQEFFEDRELAQPATAPEPPSSNEVQAVWPPEPEPPAYTPRRILATSGRPRRFPRGRPIRVQEPRRNGRWPEEDDSDSDNQIPIILLDDRGVPYSPGLPRTPSPPEPAIATCAPPRADDDPLNPHGGDYEWPALSGADIQILGPARSEAWEL